MIKDIIDTLPITKFVVIGSVPLNIRFCKDIDIICYEKDINTEWNKKDDFSGSFIWMNKKIEILLADKQESFQWILKNHYTNEYAKVYELLAIKKGHLHIAGKRQENWEKHIHDYHYLVDASVLFSRTQYQLLIDMHIKSTNFRIKQRTPKLIGVKKEDFFNDKVKKYIDHDEIHKEVAYECKPAYSNMQTSDDTVTCHKYLWDDMDYRTKLQCVVEEASVIAIERHILPAKIDGQITKPLYLAYKWALYRICTTLCSGWFRDFAQEVYFDALNCYDEVKLEKNIENILKKIRNEAKQRI